METDFILRKATGLPDQAKFGWSAPSNIAIVKYWGKKPGQIPANPSLSLTLDHCRTTTSIDFRRTAANESPKFNLLFEGRPKPDFEPKIANFFSRILPYCPFLDNFEMTIDTSNTFPHSSGIASSASAMAALAMNVMSLEKMINPDLTETDFIKKASFLARLGSGSACRSIKGNVVVWGNHAEIDGSSDLFGVEFGNVNPVFANYQDTILLVDKGQKDVSSTAGHELMHGHPFAENRFRQASENLSKLKAIIESGDLENFVKITESEALTLHAMMMTSMPYFILMKPNTLKIINAIWEFRRNTNIPVCFTLDAGANVHVLYPESCSAKVLEFIRTELVGYCENNQYICDRVGNGATLISNE